MMLFFNVSACLITNGNCTEWSAIWSKIKRVIMICNQKFDFRPKLYDTKCNFHFVIFILKSTSGNTSLFKKNTSELAPSRTWEQNDRDIKHLALLNIFGDRALDLEVSAKAWRI